MIGAKFAAGMLRANAGMANAAPGASQPRPIDVRSKSGSTV